MLKARFYENVTSSLYTLFISFAWGGAATWLVHDRNTHE